MMNKVIVLGSINMDMVMTTDRLPKIGETLLGNTVAYYGGGKGANQAVAAARVGAAVSMIGKVGQDTFGATIVDQLANEGIDRQAITVAPNAATGMAAIFKLKADNAIVVLPGANMLLDVDDELMDTKVCAGDVFVAQLEIPIETVKKGLKIAQQKGATTILNPAPYTNQINELLPYVDIITPNETELEGLLDHQTLTSETIERTMLAWARKHEICLIVTRGNEGVSYTTETMVKTIPAKAVDVVDTTGAGDTFTGILAAQLAQGRSIEQAVTTAGLGATLSVTKLGAQTGMPTQADIDCLSKS